MSKRSGSAALGALLVACAASGALGQARLVTWNISFYAGGREADFKTAVYSSFNGRSMTPDVLMAQEITSVSAATSLLTYLNTAPGSPGDWSMFSFVDGPDTDNAVYFRVSKFTPVSPAGPGDPDGLANPVLVVPGGNPNGAPRNVHRYDLRLAGYSAASTVISLYPVHMKSGSASSDQSRRLDEATKIRADMSALPTGWNFLVAGDYNVQASTQAAYQALVGPPALGRVNDPISTSGAWNNNAQFRYVHTQDPIGAGGMDDRHDQILISDSLVNGSGCDYIGSFGVPYRTDTWNDTNHTYRSWGNDGSSFDTTLTVANNQMVGPAIAQALINMCNGAGHLPVFLDVRVPAKVTSETSLNFGEAFVGDPAVTRQLNVSNAGNVSVWTAAGIADLSYSMTGPAGYAVPAGTFNDAAGGGGNAHTVSLATDEPGEYSGVITIASNDPDQPSRTVTVTGTIWCRADFDRSGFVDIEDFDAFVAAFEEGTDNADFDGSGFVDIEDFDAFVQQFESGC